MDIEDCMSVAEAAQALGVTRGRVWQLLRAGRLAYAFIGRVAVLSRAEVGKHKRLPVGRPVNQTKGTEQ